MTKTLIPVGESGFYTNNFDALRLAMALLVVFAHSYSITLGRELGESVEPFAILTHGHYNSGNIGVWGFFIMSGFLVSRSWDRSRSLREFAFRRIRRILPGYLVATSLCAFAVTPLFAPPAFTLTPVEVVRTIGANLVLANHFPIENLFSRNPIAAINGSLWSIRFEFLCYVGLAGLGILSVGARRLTLPLLYVAVVLIWCWLDATGRTPGNPPWLAEIIGWPYLWFMVLPNFLGGMIVYHYRASIPRSLPALIAGLVVLFVIFHVAGASLAGTIAAHLLGPPLLTYLIFWLAYHPRVQLSGVARHGDFSYGTYLYAYVIQQSLFATLDLPMPVFILLSIALSLAAGVASWWLVERRFLGRHGDRPAEHAPEKEEAPAHA